MARFRPRKANIKFTFNRLLYSKTTHNGQWQLHLPYTFYNGWALWRVYSLRRWANFLFFSALKLASAHNIHYTFKLSLAITFLAHFPSSLFCLPRSFSLRGHWYSNDCCLFSSNYDSKSYKEKNNKHYVSALSYCHYDVNSYQTQTIGWLVSFHSHSNISSCLTEYIN